MNDISEPAPAASVAKPSPASRSSSIDRVPVLGYRNYWYPTAESRGLKGRPLRLGLMGENVVFFRHSQTNAIVAMDDRCPHRGSSLALGHSYFPGTISCPYHG